MDAKGPPTMNIWAQHSAAIIIGLIAGVIYAKVAR